MFDVATAVEQAGLGSASDFLTAARNDTFLLRDIDASAKSLEGYLFPDTYQFTRIDSAHDIAAAMVHRFHYLKYALALVLVHAMGGLVLPVSAAIFVVAWVFQFVGHKIEGKKPSFFEDIQYLWVGPLFVLSKLFLRLGIRW